jgi:hypothetical protein
MAMKRCLLRDDAACTPRAINSLPVPLSPSNSTVASLLATFSMVRQDAQHFGIAGDQAARTRLLHELQANVLLLQIVEPEGTVDRQPACRSRRVWRRNRRHPRPTALKALLRSFCPVRTMTFVSGSGLKDFFEQMETLGNRVGIGRQAKIHGHHRRQMTAKLSQRALPVAGGQRFVFDRTPSAICFCNAGSSSTISRGRIFSELGSDTPTLDRDLFSSFEQW